MLFEVFRETKRLMCTQSASCIPSADKLDAMQKSGYKFRMNGKIISVKKLKETV